MRFFERPKQAVAPVTPITILSDHYHQWHAEPREGDKLYPDGAWVKDIWNMYVPENEKTLENATSFMQHARILLPRMEQLQFLPHKRALLDTICDEISKKFNQAAVNTGLTLAINIAETEYNILRNTSGTYEAKPQDITKENLDSGAVTLDRVLHATIWAGIGNDLYEKLELRTFANNHILTLKLNNSREAQFVLTDTVSVDDNKRSYLYRIEKGADFKTASETTIHAFNGLEVYPLNFARFSFDRAGKLTPDEKYRDVLEGFKYHPYKASDLVLAPA